MVQPTKLFLDLTTSPPWTASACPSPDPTAVGGKSVKIFARYYGVGNLSFFCPIEGCDHTFATSHPLYKHFKGHHNFTGFFVS